MSIWYKILFYFLLPACLSAQSTSFPQQPVLIQFQFDTAQLITGFRQVKQTSYAMGRKATVNYSVNNVGSLKVRGGSTFDGKKYTYGIKIDENYPPISVSGLSVTTSKLESLYDSMGRLSYELILSTNENVETPMIDTLWYKYQAQSKRPFLLIGTDSRDFPNIKYNSTWLKYSRNKIIALDSMDSQSIKRQYTYNKHGNLIHYMVEGALNSYVARADYFPNIRKEEYHYTYEYNKRGLITKMYEMDGSNNTLLFERKYYPK